MTRIVAVADTHISGEVPERLASALRGADLILHAGDFDTVKAYEAITSISKTVAVSGNSDPPELKEMLPERTEVVVEGVRIGLVHIASHSKNSIGPSLLAREMEVDVLVFGHVHRPYVEEAGDRLLICPGSPTLPRMSPPTVAEVNVDGGKVAGRIVPLGAPVCNYLKFADSLVKR